MSYLVNFPNFIFINIIFPLKSTLLVFGTETLKGFDDSKRFRLILWAIIAGTRGGPNRARILNLINVKQLNEHQISKELNLDHKTVHHHLQILIKNSLIHKLTEESYDVKYTLTPIMKKNYQALEEIISKINR